MKQLILDYTPYCTRAAIVENGKLEDFSVERAHFRGVVGNIYKGKVENVICGMQAAFVNIGEERNGFLYTGDSLVSSRPRDHTPARRQTVNGAAPSEDAPSRWERFIKKLLSGDGGTMETKGTIWEPFL